MQPIGPAVIGVGYWGPNLVRTAMSTSSLRLKWLLAAQVSNLKVHESSPPGHGVVRTVS
jgi:hypothetical protein